MKKFWLNERITNPQSSTNIDLSVLEQLLQNQEQRIINSINSASPEFLQSKVAENLQKQINTLEVFHEDNVKTLRQLKAELQNANKKPIDRVTQLLEDFNNLDEDMLRIKMLDCQLKPASINKIIAWINDRRKQAKFSCLKEVVSPKSGEKKSPVSDTSLVTLLDNWK